MDKLGSPGTRQLNVGLNAEIQQWGFPQGNLRLGQSQSMFFAQRHTLQATGSNHGQRVRPKCPSVNLDSGAVQFLPESSFGIHSPFKVGIAFHREFQNGASSNNLIGDFMERQEQ